MYSLRLLPSSLAVLVLASCASVSAMPAHASPPDPLPAYAATGATSHAPNVVVISLDGFRADYFDRHETPALQQLASAGVHAQWMIPSFPTLTYPNHYALLTGRYPDHNGIVDNYMQDPDMPGMRFAINSFQSIDNPRWWNEATPIWYTLHQAGGRSAEMDWPGADVAYDGVVPDLEGSQYEPEVPAVRADTVVRWLALPAWQRPRLVLVHFELVDATGHLHGPDSPQMDAAIRSVDAAVGQIVDALKRDGEYADTDIIVLSDHGMAAVNPGQTVYLDDVINVAAVDLVTQDALAGMNPHDTPAGRAATAALLRPHAHMRCYRKQDLPPHLHYGSNRRVPKIECLAQPGWVIETHRFAAARPFVLRGDHGYDNAATSMRALFIAEGPAFERGMLAEPFPNVDVYPLLTHLLGLAGEPGDGALSQVAGFLKPAAR